MNCIHYYLTSGGIIGFIMFLYIILKGKKMTMLYKYTTLIYLSLSLIAAMQASCVGLILLTLILSNNVKKHRMSINKIHYGALKRHAY